MVDGQAMRAEFAHHGLTPPFIGIDDDHRALHRRGAVSEGEVDRRHRPMASALQSHAMDTTDMSIDDVPTAAFGPPWLVRRQPFWKVRGGSKRMNIGQDGPAKSCAHGARRSQNMHADKTLDGREQGHDGRTVIGRGRQEKHTIEVAQHKGRCIIGALDEGFGDVAHDQTWVKAPSLCFHTCNRLSKRSQSWVIVPRTALKTFLGQAIVEPEQPFRSSNAPSGGRHQKRVRFGQRPASGVQSEQVKGGIRMCFGQPNISSKVAQKPSKGGDSCCIDRPPAFCHTPQMMAAFAFCGTDDEDGFPGHRLLNPPRKWAEGNDLKGRHAPKTASGFLNTLRDVAMLLQKGSRFMIEDEEDGM